MERFELLCAIIITAMACCVLIKSIADRRYKKRIEALKEELDDIKKETEQLQEKLCETDTRLSMVKDLINYEINEIWSYLRR